jgi:hypothetical protein
MARSVSVPSGQLVHRRGDYGFDEPVWPLLQKMGQKAPCL